jgi:signal transduction histidine kinase
MSNSSRRYGGWATLLEKIRRLRRTVAFRLALWYAAFFTGCILIAFIAFYIDLLTGIHHVELSRRSLHELLEAYRGFFGISLAGVALASIFVGWFLARRALSGVEDVRQTAQSIAKGAFDSRVPVKGTGDEVDQLAITFNGMLGQIQTVLSSMKEITDNIAHDLRSPITRMRGMRKWRLRARGRPGITKP